MPQFRMHNPRNRSDRVLIRMVHNKNVLTTQQPYHGAVSAAPIVVTQAVVDKPKKKKISMKHIQEILKLLQQSKNKNVTKLLTSNLKGLMSQQDDEDVDIDEVEEESEVEIEEVEGDEDVNEEDEDVLIIDL